jgi:hypothetical protein
MMVLGELALETKAAQTKKKHLLRSTPNSEQVLFIYLISNYFMFAFSDVLYTNWHCVMIPFFYNSTYIVLSVARIKVGNNQLIVQYYF